MTNTESGAVIFWILIVVAMFAAITAVISSGSRTQSSLMTDQQVRMHAMEIIAYGNDVRQAVQNLRINGCSDEQISFANTIYRGPSGPSPLYADGHNGNAPTDGSCEVFKLSGAGLTPQQFPKGTLEDSSGNTRSGDAAFTLTKVEGIGSAEPELALYIEKIDPQVCDTISQVLNITQNGVEAPIDAGGTWTSYGGTYDSLPFQTYGDTSTALVGKNAFCVKSATGGPGIFISVLVAR